MQFSIAVMAHHTRQDNLKNVVEALTQQGVPESDINTIIDYDSEGIWATAMKAWLSHSDFPHHLVLQDDIVISKDFISIVNSVLQTVDDNFAASFCDKLHNMKRVYSQNKHWLATTQVRHAQALLLPVSWIEDWLTWSEWNVRPEYYHDDGRLEMWLKHTNQVIHHSVPSLIEHKDSGSVFTQAQGKDKISIPYSCWKFIEDDDRQEYTWDVKPTNVYKYRYVHNNNEQLFALGYDMPLQILEQGSTNSRILNFESISTPYEEIMKHARKERGLT